jgi:hypothetical protein
MASNGDRRGGLLTAGGVLSIIAGAFRVIGGAGIAVVCGTGWLPRIGELLLNEHACLQDGRFPFGIAEWVPWESLMWLSVGGVVIGIILGILGIIAIAGGISAIKRSSFGLSLAGAICAFIPFHLLGLLAIIFVSLGKREFEAKE